jgi:hypothetical protein
MLFMTDAMQPWLEATVYLDLPLLITFECDKLEP